MDISGTELVKRIARLVRQNQELIQENDELKNRLFSQTNQLERLEKKLEALSVHPGETVFPPEKELNLRFEMATVMFVNIHGFSKIDEGIDSVAAMDELDDILFHFDRILKKYKTTRIKTIGDTIMAAGGIPVKNITNPIEVVLSALEIQHYMHEKKKEGTSHGIWELKIGIHTGPVNATKSGKRKISYDIKGDTVNLAARLQSYAKSDEVLVSVMTYELVKEFFTCEYSGIMPAKIQKDLEVFSVKSLGIEYDEEFSGIVPNRKFDIRFKLIQFTDLQEFMLDKLEKELPKSLYYHNVKHTVDVVTEVELIGLAEGLEDEEILLLKTAGLFHDAGHIISYDNHEYEGTVLVRKMLPGYGYREEQIDKICRLIMATKLPPKPADILEAIICDADLDYLGRSDMVPVSNTLYKELKEQDKIGSIDDWNRLQISFISGHQYFTTTARSLREVQKQKQIRRLERLLKASGEPVGNKV